MFFNFVLRTLRKRFLLNFIKVLGLALGLSGILFITLFLKNELSYDTFHSKANRIYRLTTTSPQFLNNAHFARIHNSEQVPEIAEYFPEIESFVRLAPLKGGVMMHNEKYFSINEAFICDSTFFKVFDAELLIGDKNTILNGKGSMVVTESFAQKLFGADNPVGQTLTLPPGQFYGVASNFTIKGVMKDFPQNSHFHPDLITTHDQDEIGWWAFSYLLLNEHANPENIISAYPDFLEKTDEQSPVENEIKVYLQKITDIHLHSDKLREIENNGNITNIYVLTIAALILLLISISNYASLNLGMAGFHQKFFRVNRIMGSSKNTNLKYFAIESLYIIFASIALSFLISVPAKLFIQEQFHINLFEENLILILAVVFLFIVCGVLAGLQPVLKQNIKNAYNMQNNNLVRTNSIFVSRGIIISQFVFAIALIVAVLAISKQTHFVQSHSMGVQEDNVICLESVHSNVQRKFEVFKSELLKHNTIESVSAMLEPPGGEANDMFRFEMEDYEKSEELSNNLLGVFPCDYSFAEIFKLEFLGGNNFTESNVDVEGSGEYIINETAMHQLNYKNPDNIVGKGFKLLSPVESIGLPNGKIIGVVKDFHLSSMKKKVGPLVLFKRDKIWLINFVISYKPGMQELAIKEIRDVWKEIFPAYSFNYEHVGAMYKKVYKMELLQARLLSLFTVLSIFICSMGLLGLSLLISQQRTKEIGIRKAACGARVSEIIMLLNKSFVKWIAIAFIIAVPIAWYAMHIWLKNFVYKIELSWWIFALAGLLAMGIAMLTVSFQSWKIATKNPVDALRYD